MAIGTRWENSYVRPMTWRRLRDPLVALAAHGLLLSFTVLLVLKLDRLFSPSWGVIFLPVFLFHAIMARHKISIPAPLRRNRHWAPFHATVATPLMVAFEVLLCAYLESKSAHGKPCLSLGYVFLPMEIWQIIVIIENFMKCYDMIHEPERYLIPEAFWLTLRHFAAGLFMTFLLTATLIAVFKLTSDPSAASLPPTWLDFLLNIGVAHLFGFAVWAKLAQPTKGDQLDQTIMLLNEEEKLDNLLNLKDIIGGYVAMMLFFAFEVLLYLHLEGLAPLMPVRVIFLPIQLLQVAGVVLAIWRLTEKLVILFYNGSINEWYFAASSEIQEYFMFLHRGSRLISWWSIDEGSKEEQARLCYANENTGYGTFCSYPPEKVMDQPRNFLISEVQRLQRALQEQTVIARESRENCEGLQNDKALCRICYAEEINTVLIPCRHHILCQSCSMRCSTCPCCRQVIETRMLVYDTGNEP